MPKKGQTKAPRLRAMDRDYHLECFKWVDDGHDDHDDHDGHDDHDDHVDDDDHDDNAAKDDDHDNNAVNDDGDNTVDDDDAQVRGLLPGSAARSPRQRVLAR